MAGDFDIGPGDWEADRAADELTRTSQEMGLYATGGDVNGKGDAPRPMAIGPDAYARRWAETFSNGEPVSKGGTPPDITVMRWINGVRVDADGKPLETFASPCGAFDRVGSLVTCDTLGPNGSCLACGKGLETLGNPEE